MKAFFVIVLLVVPMVLQAQIQITDSSTYQSFQSLEKIKKDSINHETKMLIKETIRKELDNKKKYHFIELDSLWVLVDNSDGVIQIHIQYKYGEKIAHFFSRYPTPTTKLAPIYCRSDCGFAIPVDTGGVYEFESIPDVVKVILFHIERLAFAMRD